MTGFFTSQRAGFTLIEVVVVMAMVAILAATTVLSLAFYIPNLRLRSASQELNLQIQKARLEAIYRSTPVAVRFFITKPSGTRKYGPIIWVDSNYNAASLPEIDPGEEILYGMPVEDLPGSVWELLDYGGIRFDSSISGIDGLGDGITFPDNTFVLNSRGISNRTGSIFLLNARGRSRQVMVTLGGAVRAM